MKDVDIQQYTTIYNNIQQYTTIYNNIQYYKNGKYCVLFESDATTQQLSKYL